MTQAATVSAVLLAAGSSRRFGGANKLLAEAAGVPLALAVARALEGARLAELVVVTGHDADRIEALLSGLGARFVHNRRHGEGIGGSIATGVAALGDGVAGALIAQADMPALTAALIDRLIRRFEEAGSARIVHPVGPDGRQRNPVIWPRRYFPELVRLSGDTGAKALIERCADGVETVPVGDEAAFVDLDTADELARYNRALRDPRT